MRKKLTVYCEPDITKIAKKIALDNDMSLSDVIENLLYNLDKVILKSPNGNDHTIFDFYGKQKIDGLPKE